MSLVAQLTPAAGAGMQMPLKDGSPGSFIATQVITPNEPATKSGSHMTFPATQVVNNPEAEDDATLHAAAPDDGSPSIPVEAHIRNDLTMSGSLVKPSSHAHTEMLEWERDAIREDQAPSAINTKSPATTDSDYVPSEVGTSMGKVSAANNTTTTDPSDRPLLPRMAIKPQAKAAKAGGTQGGRQKQVTLKKQATKKMKAAHAKTPASKGPSPLSGLDDSEHAGPPGSPAASATVSDMMAISQLQMHAVAADMLPQLDSLQQCMMGMAKTIKINMTKVEHMKAILQQIQRVAGTSVAAYRWKEQ